ncbi:MAG: VIT domain-containing protein [Thermomicrobiales bacterium]
MRTHWLRISFLIALVATLIGPLGARADGVIIVEPPQCDPACDGPVYVGDQLTIRWHRVNVSIDDQIATTEIDQLFYNQNDWTAEGTYIFPIPEDAPVDQFTMIVDGQEVEAKVLSADEARAIYEEIVRNMRDPALLEYMGRGAIQASIFPIEPGAERQIQIRYQQALTAENGLVHYVYPLNTERFSATPLEQASVSVQIASSAPLRAIYSPSHSLAVSRIDANHAAVGWEGSNVLPADDFELFYTTSDSGIGVNLVSDFDPIAGEGTFLLLAAPGIDQNQPAVAKDVIVVLDTSGSMDGEKIEQAKGALASVLEKLNAEDRFTIVEFSTGVRTYSRELLASGEAPAALDWVRRLQATGGTDIDGALQTALSLVDTSRPTYLLFLTDGLPTEGETSVPAILDHVSSTAPDGIRLFSFGVGDDVDTILLDTIAQQNHGASVYVRPGEQLDQAVAELYGKISTPVLTDVSVSVDGAQIEELYPNPMPDLYAGSQAIIVGKYRAGGPVTITLSGTVNGEVRHFVYEGQSLATGPGAEALPRLWATRKIGYLLTQIRLYGENPEWVQAIVDLSVRYGIVTPYTSYLITEDDILTESGRAQAAATQSAEYEEPRPSSGSAAVSEAQDQASMSGGASGDSAVEAPSAEYADQVMVIGSRAFLLVDGIWTETTFDPSTMETIKVQFLSDDYFALLTAKPELAGPFGLGEQVIAFADGVAFEVTADEQPPLDPALLVP